MFSNKEPLEIRDLIVGDILDIALSNLRMCVTLVFFDDLVDFPSSNVSHNSNSAACTVLKDELARWRPCELHRNNYPAMITMYKEGVVLLF